MSKQHPQRSAFQQAVESGLQQPESFKLAQQGLDDLSKVTGAIPAGLTPALFTAHELEALRTICRDSDNESARRILTAGLDRAASKPVIRPVDSVG